MKTKKAAKRDAAARSSLARGSAFVALVGYPRDSLAGRYLQRPRDPKEVKRNGYGFTLNASEAWPFKSERAALAKARIVERHMGWGEGVMIVEQRPPLGLYTPASDLADMRDAGVLSPNVSDQPRGPMSP